MCSANGAGRAGRRGAGSESERRRRGVALVPFSPLPHLALSLVPFSLFSTKIAGAHAICRRSRYVIILYHVFAYGQNWAVTRKASWMRGYWLGDFIASALMPRSSSRVSSTVIRWLDNDNDDDDFVSFAVPYELNHCGKGISTKKTVSFSHLRGVSNIFITEWGK